MEKSYFYRNARFWLWVIGPGGLLVYLISFNNELFLVLKYLIETISNLTVRWQLSNEEQRAWGILLYGLIGNFVFFNAFLFFFSQFILPVKTLEQRFMMFVHAWYYVIGWHGPAVFVEGGKLTSNREELKKELPGVVFVDGNSAVAIEKLWAKGAPKGGFSRSVSFSKIRGEGKEFEMLAEIDESLREKRFTDRKATARVEGPGFVFTKKDERVAGAVGLGKQNRKIASVLAKTRDGIDLLADVNVTFTIGEKPDKIVVAEISPGKFQKVTIKESSAKANGETVIQKIVERLDDVLTEAQVEEIIRYKNDALSNLSKSNNRLLTFESADKRARKPPTHQVISGAIYDPERVFRAFYSASNNPAKNERLDWAELPAKVAADEFRTLINKENFDELYRPRDVGKPHISRLKEELKNRIIELGVLNFELVIRKSRILFVAIGDDIADSNKFLILPEQPFKEYRILRERGIKVLDASFVDLKPVLTDEVMEQRFAYWQSVWQKYELFADAEHHLEATRIRNQARAQTQQEMIYTLSQIFRSTPHTDEALAMRIYQALEAAATEPIARKLLPQDTVAMLTQLREWLTVEDEGSNRQGPGSNRGVLDE